MTLREIFERKVFINFRDKELDETDIKYFLNRLKKNGIYDVLPFLGVIKKVPIELLEPIMREAIKYKDVSLPKRYMDTICRLFTPKYTQDVILKIILGKENYKNKCKATGILYSIGGFMSSSGRDDNGNIKWKCGTGFIWNGQRYEKKCMDGDLNHFIKRRNKFYKQRIETLTNQFLNSKNIVFRYFLSRYLPNGIEEYPIEIIEKAKKVISITSKEEFPNGLNQVEQLKKAVKGNSELEKLLFEELNWQKK